MNWNAVGAISETIGVIAVFVTLVYLAIQVRDAKYQVKRSIQQVRSSTLRELYLSPVQNPQLVSVLIKSERAWTSGNEIESEEELFEAGDLTPEEALIWQSYQRAWWVHWREVVGNRDQLSESQMDEVNMGIVSIFTRSSSRVYLNSMWVLDSPTIRYIKNLLAESKR
ncbi:MAG: hypothetical protein KDI33_05160 [Halioglobus sp.]|nr:hypothetical protein [Halioglobus sp.]